MMLCAASRATRKRCPTPSLSTTGGPSSGKEPRKGSALPVSEEQWHEGALGTDWLGYKTCKAQLGEGCEAGDTIHARAVYTHLRTAAGSSSSSVAISWPGASTEPSGSWKCTWPGGTKGVGQVAG